MNIHSTLPGGAPSRARSRAEPPCVAYGELDGERIARVSLQGGGHVVVSAHVWEKLDQLGYVRSAPRLIGNGSGSSYVALSSSPDRLGRGHTLTVAPLTLAILAAEGEVTLPHRWRVRTRNGDPLDLRVGNLEAVPAERGRSASRVLADVRKRCKLVRQGRDPNAIFAERRRAARSKCRDCGMRESRRADALAASPLGGPTALTAQEGR